ncbi:MAG: sodium:proton antiporter [Spirochaetaceae bacterium]|nr:sodium:proton antiporter [Spirochaetaceae bacterium]
MKNQMDSPIILLGARLLSPYIMMFGLYVIFHGHYSPGGGFQGGALLASSILLVRIAGGTSVGRLQIKKVLTTPMAAVGVMIYFATGLTALVLGGQFLDYAYLPNPGIEPVMLRYWGMLIIELGIGLAVMAILIMIYDNLTAGEDHV